jgi:hypothetical protein
MFRFSFHDSVLTQSTLGYFSPRNKSIMYFTSYDPWKESKLVKMSPLKNGSKILDPSWREYDMIMKRQQP